MKKNYLLKKVKTVANYAIKGFCLQAFFVGFLWASDLKAQKESLNEIYITIDLKGVNIEDAFSLISQKTGFNFVYNSTTLNLKQKITINANQQELYRVLIDLSKKANVQFKRVNNSIYVKNILNKEIKVVEDSEIFQVRTIAGTVVSFEDSSPLPGVNVVEKGTLNGTVTDIDGRFNLQVQEGAIITFSSVGFVSEDIVVGSQSVIDVSLVQDLQALEEVVVIGYTTQKKATITGSIATITTRDLRQSPTANINNALAGRMPGLMVNQFSGGEPGVDRSDIYVRGYGTYNDKSPIVIVDGVERSMNYLSPEEIETFTILKDASATAAFGVRGANGVIVITTKRGEVTDRPDVNFKSSIGINQPVKFPKYLGSAQYAELYNEALLNDARGGDPAHPLFSNQAIENFRMAKGDNSDGLGYNWDYFDYAFKPGIQEDYSLSLQGGSAKARYYVMANYYQQSGNYTHTDLAEHNTQAVFKRYNFRSNIDIDMSDNFYARLDIGARITDRNAPGTTAARIVEIANTQPSYLPIVVEMNDNPDNQKYAANNPLGMLFGDQFYRYNILGELSRTGFLNEKNTYVDGSFAIGHKLDYFIKGLKVEGVFSYDASEGRWLRRDVPTYTEGYREYPSYATFRPIDGTDIYMEPGSYDGVYDTGNKYEIDQTIRNEISRNSTVGRTYLQAKVEYSRRFGLHDVNALVLTNRSRRDVNNDVAYCYQGIVARAAYGYDSRYLFELNMGYNGSENFTPGRRYGFFPAVSAGWVISNEDFLAGARSWLNNLKIRGAYGLVGSDRIPNNNRFIYAQYFRGGDNYYFGDDNFGNSAGGGTREGDLANEKLTWEKARKANIGIDGSFFEGKLSLVADVFQEHRYDIITDLGNSNRLGFPAVVGKSAPYINSGIVDNYGIDLEIGWKGNIGQDFRYYIKPNFTFARNEIIFENEVPRDYPWRARTGKRIDEHFVYVFDRFVRDEDDAATLNAMNEGAGFQPWGQLGPGDVVYKDLNEDGRIEELGDQKAMGSPRTPEIQFGVPLGFYFKGFDFSMMFQGATNTSLQLHGAAVWDFPLFSHDKIGKVKPMHLNRWTPETAETASYPALHYGDHSNNKNSNSSLYLYDASYVRLKTLEIGYNLPMRAIQFANLKHVRIYAQGLNLFTWDELSDVDVDPETREGSGDWYPVQKVFNFGIDVTF